MTNQQWQNMFKFITNTGFFDIDMGTIAPMFPVSFTHEGSHASDVAAAQTENARLRMKCV